MSLSVLSTQACNEFWAWYAIHQNDEVRIPGVGGGFLGLFTKLNVRRFRALFEIPFGPKPDGI
jgi:hypothetical protein